MGLYEKGSWEWHSFALGVAAPYSRSRLRLAFRSAQALQTMPRGSALLGRRSLRRRSLPSASVFVMSHDITGFTHRGLDFDELSRVAPHKFTPMPGGHKALPRTRTSLAAEL
jgi:hypothetical protein